jgi:hypothetical protein
VKAWAREIRELATVLADQCGCRHWRVHRGVALWRVEEKYTRGNQ